MKELIKECRVARVELDEAQSIVRDLRQHPDLDAEAPGIDKAEIRGNIMLAYRHLEDARMRLGKVIQHAEGGVSKYDQPPHTNNAG